MGKGYGGAAIAKIHIVLYQPEIPPNTGNIARTCVATGSPLHLIEPLGFEINDSQLKRAGLDYWKHLSLYIHKNDDEFFSWLGSRNFWLATKRKSLRYDQVPYQDEDAILLGRETTGLPVSWFEKWPDKMIYIPMWGETRSLNLSNAAAIFIYEAYRHISQFEIHI